MPSPAVLASARPSTKLDWALYHLNRGWAILPLWWIRADGSCACAKTNCPSPGKHPLGPLVPHGHKNATHDARLVRQWWSQYPEANIGGATGPASGRSVLDVDPRNGGDLAFESITLEYGAIPDTPRHRSQSGGSHYIFAHRSGDPATKKGFAPGLDWLSDPGFVVLPGSIGPKGPYTELPGWGDDEVALSDPQDWLLNLIRRQNGCAPPAGVTVEAPAMSLPVGRRTRRFISGGAPIGQQRTRACGAARNLLSAGLSVDDTAQMLWAGFQACRASGQYHPEAPWTFGDAVAIASDLACRPSPRLLTRPRPPGGELLGSPHNVPLGGEDDNSPAANLQRGLGSLPGRVFKEAPRRKRTAALLEAIGETKKAEAESACGVPMKGKCPNHGAVRRAVASGKTPWCAGCNTETSAKYVHTNFPGGAYSILRLQHRLGPVNYDTAVVDGVTVIAGDDEHRIEELVKAEFKASTGHFKRVQRRFKSECLAWHFAVGHGPHGLWTELQVLVRHGSDLEAVLRELRGETRKAALWQPDLVERYDYPTDRHEQLRNDWAGLLKCSLLRLDDDLLFSPIYFALKGRQLCMAYGEMRQAVDEGKHVRDEQRAKIKKCPVVEDGRVCGQRLDWVYDLDDKQPLYGWSPPWENAA